MSKHLRFDKMQDLISRSRICPTLCNHYLIPELSALYHKRSHGGGAVERILQIMSKPKVLVTPLESNKAAIEQLSERYALFKFMYKVLYIISHQY